MAPRNPLRPKAANIPDDGFLRSVSEYLAGRGLEPARRWGSFPEKVYREKVRKLTARGLLSRDMKVTQAGYSFLAGLEQQEAAP